MATTTLKCVGGPLHGRKHRMNGNVRRGDIVRFPLPMRLDVSVEMPTLDNVPKLVTLAHTSYTVQKMYYHDEFNVDHSWVYLSPVGSTRKDDFYHLFNSVREPTGYVQRTIGGNCFIACNADEPGAIPIYEPEPSK